MEVRGGLENSLIAQNWPYCLLSLLVTIVCGYVAKRLKWRTLHGDTETPLDGEELVGEGLDLDGEELIGEVFQPRKEQQPEDYQPTLEEKEHIPYGGARVTLPQGARQFYRLVNDRRSVRSFSRRPVQPELIRDCIRSAGTAPSGAHTEPWTFCVVSRAELKQQIRRIVELEESLNYGHRMHRQWTADLRPLRTDHVKPYLTDAPYLLVVFKQTYGLLEDGRRRNHYYNELSVAIAVGLLLGALQAAGLSSLVTTPLNCGPSLRSLLDRPENEKLLMLLPVGYAADDCRVPDLRRKPLEEIMLEY